MEKTWRKAIIKVLKEAGAAMHYGEIAETILAKGYYKPDGATPAATVNAQIASSIKSEGEKSPFRRISPGVFILRDLEALQDAPGAPEAGLASVPAKDKDTVPSFINAFGMYWRRELVNWKNSPNLYGRAPASSVVIDFSKQRGIYLLYDRHMPVYVGRSTDQTIADRLYVHTNGRIAGRWDRFSWFGVLEPDNEGFLQNTEMHLSEASVIATLEAILIESLEPSQNRRQGDGLAGREFIQEIDPILKKKQIAATLQAVGHTLAQD